MTDSSGNVMGTNVRSPYGQVISGNTGDPYPFAGLAADLNGTRIAQFRDYGTAPGRWLRPDPYNGSYDLSNPQSFNRYMYVGGNPLAFADPNGLWLCPPSICGSPSTTVTSYGVPTDLSWLGPTAAAVDVGLVLVDVINGFFGLWGGPPQFTGNVQAAQAGKNVPQQPGQNCGFWHPCTTVHVYGNNPPPPDTTPSSVVQTVPGVSMAYPWNWNSGNFQNMVPGTQWCGPGGWGSPTGPVDNACMIHDFCYNNLGINAWDNVSGGVPASAKAGQALCDQQFCTAVEGLNHLSPAQAAQAFLVKSYFHCP